jgi:hypothetical protein
VVHRLASEPSEFPIESKNVGEAFDFDPDQSSLFRWKNRKALAAAISSGCNDCTLGPGRPRLDEVRGRSACLALPSGSAAPTTLGIVWGAKAEPPVSRMPGGFAE